MLERKMAEITRENTFTAVTVYEILDESLVYCKKEKKYIFPISCSQCF